MNLFSLNSVSAGYAGKAVLHDLSFTIDEGEFIGIVGANGSGKSTLLRLMTGLLSPQTGTVLFKGTPLDRFTGLQRAGEFGTVFLHKEGLPSFTAAEYIAQRLFARGLQSGQKQDDEVRRAMESTGTQPFAERNIRTLSAGEMQLVSIAGALAQNRRLLFLDEPTSHLDIRNSLETADLLAKLHRSGTTVITVFHDINLALSLCGRIIALSHGRLACDSSPEAFADGHAAQAIFGVRHTAETDPFTGKPRLLFGRL